MKILIMSNHFHPYAGGLENYAMELATRLAKNHEVQVMSIKHNPQLPATQQYKGFLIRRLPQGVLIAGSYSLFNPFSKLYRKQIRAIKEWEPDVIFTNTRFFPTSMLGARLAKKIGTKHIHIEHGNTFVQYKYKLIEWCARLLDETMGRYVFRSANATIGISDPCERFAKQLGAKKTYSIPNSIDTSTYVRVNKAKTTLKIPEELTVVGFLGRLIYGKGVQHIIEALKGKKHILLLVVGSGPYQEELEEQAKKAGIQARFVGNQPYEKTPLYYSAMDIFVNPSYAEGLPTSVLEAGVLGVPIIATNVGGTKQIIKNNKTGLLITSHQTASVKKAIHTYLEDKKFREQMGKACSKHIRKEFDWNNTIKRIEKVIS